MYLEFERRRSRRAQRKHQKQQKRKYKPRPSALAAPLAMANDNQVLTFREWCRLNRISERTGRRIRKSGHGPPFMQLSARRIGVTIRANREWQEQRARGVNGGPQSFGPKRGSTAQGAGHGDLHGRQVGAEATSTQSKCLSVFGGSRCISHLLFRGRQGIEAFDRDERSIGVFPGRQRAVAAIAARRGAL